jgi:hypothetical protein
MSINPNNLQSTANQMRRNNADLTGDNAANPSIENANQSNISLPVTTPAAPNPPTLIQSTASTNSQTPIPITPIPPKPKNAPAAKAPTGSASQTVTAKSISQSKANPKHPLSLDEVATSAEKHRQSAKQYKEIAEILGAKTSKSTPNPKKKKRYPKEPKLTKRTVDLEKAYVEKTVAAKAN